MSHLTATELASWDLPESVRLGIADAGFRYATPIQERVLSLALAGRDVAGQAQTGTGKTAAFLISGMTRLLRRPAPESRRGPRLLAVAPTRELAQQIRDDAEKLGVHTGLSILAVFGGVDYRKQRDALRLHPDILIGTPGRLLDYEGQGATSFRDVEVLVIDEADRMFDMGFIRDLRKIFRRCPPYDRRQSMLFSATLSPRVMELAYEHMNDAVRVEVEPERVTARGIRECLYHVPSHEKLSLLLGLLERDRWERTLIFVNRKTTAAELVAALSANGYPVSALAGNVKQQRRMKILQEFKEGRASALIATDVASRGLHIEGVTHVVNYDLPQDPEDYVHRIGRTARAGAEGDAISFADEEYVFSLDSIEKLIGRRIPAEVADPALYRHPEVRTRISRPHRGAGPRGPRGPHRPHAAPGRAPRSAPAGDAERASPEGSTGFGRSKRRVRR
ncbi:MAG TPA: DEAD/DEAH box helicase [Thermoanaerobaculia bacterium]|nr:DEAD/DEAH box helicase [Thermoanaerobaculia bacterium]